MSLKKFRTERGLTQKDMADFLGCTQVTYQRYESGDREPSLEILKKLSRFFVVSIDQLLDDSDSTEPKTDKESENELLLAFRQADKRARLDALKILKSHKA